MSWVARRQTLRFQFSDWTLMSASIPLQVRSVSLTEPQPAVTEPSPPDDALTGDSQGFMLRALPVARALQPGLSRHGSFLRYVLLSYRHFFIDMAGDFDAYRRKFSGKTRSTLDRKVRKFAEHCGGELRWACYRTPDELRTFMPLARAVSRLSYQERLLDAGLPDSEEFLGTALRAAAEDRLRAYLLFHGERPVSYLYCPIEKDQIVIYAYLGYDPAYQRHSVGTVLQWLALEQLFGERRYRFFDFTEGESDHKQLFATDFRECANILFVRDRFPYSLWLRAHWWLARLSVAAGEFLDRFGLKARMRKLLRRAA